MNCINCGKEVKGNEKFCEDCKNKVLNIHQQKINNKKPEKKVNYTKATDDSEANWLCVLSLILTCGIGISFRNIFSLYNLPDIIQSLCFQAGIVLMIFVRIKYPENLFAKILMWIYIFLNVAMAVTLVTLMVTCFTGCSDLPG